MFCNRRCCICKIFDTNKRFIPLFQAILRFDGGVGGGGGGGGGGGVGSGGGVDENKPISSSSIVLNILFCIIYLVLQHCSICLLMLKLANT
jgi:hypothetical protein